jgi:hypothetical protein
MKELKSPAPVDFNVPKIRHKAIWKFSEQQSLDWGGTKNPCWYKMCTVASFMTEQQGQNKKKR